MVHTLQRRLHQVIPSISTRPDRQLSGFAAPVLQLIQDMIDTFVHEHAAFDSNKSARFPIHEAQVAFPSHSKPGVVSVPKLVGRWDNLPYRDIFQSAHTLERINHFAMFDK